MSNSFRKRDRLTGIIAHTMPGHVMAATNGAAARRRRTNAKAGLRSAREEQQIAERKRFSGPNPAFTRPWGAPSFRKSTRSGFCTVM